MSESFIHQCRLRWPLGTGEHISNNLSNANTAGFKEERVSFENVLSSEGPRDSFVNPQAHILNFESGNVVQDGVDTILRFKVKDFRC